MLINDNFKLATLPFTITASGVIGTTPAASVDIASSFNITCATASLAMTLATPTDATAGDMVVVRSLPASTQPFTMYGQSIAAGEFAMFSWSGTGWAYVGDTRNSGAVVPVASVAAGNNTITHNFGLPTGSFSAVLVRAYNATGNEVVFRRVPASDTTNTAVVNSTVALANITFYLTPLA